MYIVHASVVHQIDLSVTEDLAVRTLKSAGFIGYFFDSSRHVCTERSKGSGGVEDFRIIGIGSGHREPIVGVLIQTVVTEREGTGGILRTTSRCVLGEVDLNELSHGVERQRTNLLRTLFIRPDDERVVTGTFHGRPCKVNCCFCRFGCNMIKSLILLNAETSPNLIGSVFLYAL